MKTGIFGGTFNPVHCGHLRVAEEVRDTLSLDRVIFIPCFIPPHKEDADVISVHDRIDMLGLAIKGNPFFEISDLELKRGGRSYSVETLKELRRFYGPDDEFHFIIGMDSFCEIGTWKDYKELFVLADLVVARRKSGDGKAKPPNPVDLLPVDIRGDFCYDAAGKIVGHSSGHSTRFLETTRLDISSTDLRKAIASDRSIKYLVPEEVEDYIKEKKLYKGKQ